MFAEPYPMQSLKSSLTLFNLLGENAQLSNLPPNLDGSMGSNRNRAVTQTQIAARTDLEAIQVWLARYADTPTTFQNYRKEAERLLLWTLVELDKPLSSLTQEDLLRYQYFLADPYPPERWIMPANHRAGRGDPRWRPFSGPLSPASQRQAMIILSVLFSWLVTAGYLVGNPLVLSRRRTRSTPPHIIRYLTNDLWAVVKTTIESLPQGTRHDHARYHRIRWLFSLLYLCGLRISEVTGGVMGNFFRRVNPDGREYWWLEVTGKGGKVRLVPVTDELLEELIRYRQSRNLSSLPQLGEAIPLLLPIGNQRRPLTRAAVHLIVKAVFASAAKQLLEAEPDRLEQAKRLAQASTHWLRHTAGSRMANGNLDLRHVRDNLGHATLGVTSRYLHTEDDARHRETGQRHRLDWDVS
ncbi:MAG: tyrosine-type recombinase/integrase [Candidatus Contendobacter sp.]|nr:tyrosine-type recombinase/integrase [Candidatus Contendobacter sp.]MDS4060191.1 tyrosine-type recombinase/integrase [Candidatus Contendobacter sp.]